MLNDASVENTFKAINTILCQYLIKNFFEKDVKMPWNNTTLSITSDQQIQFLYTSKINGSQTLGKTYALWIKNIIYERRAIIDYGKSA